MMLMTKETKNCIASTKNVSKCLVSLVGKMMSVEELKFVLEVKKAAYKRLKNELEKSIGTKNFQDKYLECLAAENFIFGLEFALHLLSKEEPMGSGQTAHQIKDRRMTTMNETKIILDFLPILTKKIKQETDNILNLRDMFDVVVEEEKLVELLEALERLKEAAETIPLA